MQAFVYAQKFECGYRKVFFAQDIEYNKLENIGQQLAISMIQKATMQLSFIHDNLH